MGPIGCPEISVKNYLHALRNIPEERRSRLLRGGSLKLRTAKAFRKFDWKKCLQMLTLPFIYFLCILGTLVNHDFMYAVNLKRPA
jgi:hypothetical protein